MFSPIKEIVIMVNSLKNLLSRVAQLMHQRRIYTMSNMTLSNVDLTFLAHKAILSTYMITKRIKQTVNAPIIILISKLSKLSKKANPNHGQVRKNQKMETVNYPNYPKTVLLRKYLVNNIQLLLNNSSSTIIIEIHKRRTTRLIFSTKKQKYPD